MKKFVKFCMIVALILVILGIVFVVGGFAAGASWIALQNEFYEEGDYGHGGFLSFLRNYDGEIIHGKKTVTCDRIAASENIREIQVDINYGDVKIYSANEAGEKLDAGEILVEKRIREDLQTIDVQAESGVLSIREDGEPSYMNLGWSDFGGEIKIYLPEDISLDKVEIVNATGDLSIKKDLDIGSLLVELGVGDIQFDSNIQISDNMNISIGTGDIDLKDVICRGDIIVNTGVGDIDVQGEAAGNVDVESGTGDIDVFLKGDKDSYNYDITAEVGEVSLNGKDHDGIGTEIKQENCPGGSTITVLTGVGDIEVKVK